MPLTANLNVDHFINQSIREFPLAAAVHLYKGSLASFDGSGDLKPLTAGEVFAGIAFEEKDNSSGAAGDKKARVYTVGDFELALAGATAANNGVAVYASADDTLTYTSTSNTLVGKQVSVASSGVILLRIDTF